MHVSLKADELRFIDSLGNAGGDGDSLSHGRAIGFGLRGGAKGRERQKQSKNKEGIAKDERLEFHIPPTFEDLNPTAPKVETRNSRNRNATGLREGPFVGRSNWHKWLLADWGLDRNESLLNA